VRARVGDVLVDAPVAEREPVLALERQPAREHVVEQAAERVDVGRRRDRVAARLLGRPVLRAADEDARLRDALRPLRDPREAVFTGRPNAVDGVLQQAETSNAAAAEAAVELGADDCGARDDED
jgi:hypothetical protein